jgi:hypothetical protein
VGIVGRVLGVTVEGLAVVAGVVIVGGLTADDGELAGDPERLL